MNGENHISKGSIYLLIHPWLETSSIFSILIILWEVSLELKWRTKARQKRSTLLANFCSALSFCLVPKVFRVRKYYMSGDMMQCQTKYDAFHWNKCTYIARKLIWRRSKLRTVICWQLISAWIEAVSITLNSPRAQSGRDVVAFVPPLCVLQGTFHGLQCKLLRCVVVVRHH